MLPNKEHSKNLSTPRLFKIPLAMFINLSLYWNEKLPSIQIIKQLE